MKNNNIISYDVFGGCINNTSDLSIPEIEESSKSFSPLRKWQKEAFEQLKDEKYALIQAATGAGKSSFMVVDAHNWLTNNPEYRAVIAVSYKDIGLGFDKEYRHIVDDKEVKVNIKTNLACNDADDQGKIETLKDFLNLNDVSKLNVDEKIVVVTHATLVATKKKYPDLFESRNNLFLIIDETHHSSSGIDDNGLAGVINDVAKNALNKILLATATFMRGDNQSVINEDLQKSIATYKYSIDKHLAEMKHLKSYNFAVSLVSSDDIVYDEIKKLCDNKKNTVIWIPHTSSLVSLAYPDKHTFVKNIIDCIKSVRGDDCNICDLVSNADETSDTVLTKMNDFNGVVIAMNKFKEGSDWEAAEQGIVIGERGSLVDLLQMYGRLFRDYKDKTNVHMHQILPCQFGMVSTEDSETKQEINTHWKVLVALMLMEDIFIPIVLKSKKEVDSKGQPKEYKNYLEEITKNDSDKQELNKWYNEQILQIFSEKDTKDNLKKEEMVSLAEQAIQKFELEKADPELLAEYFCKRWKRKSSEQNYLIHPDDVDFDFVLNCEDIEAKTKSKLIGFDTLKDFVQAISNRKTWSKELVLTCTKEIYPNVTLEFYDESSLFTNKTKFKATCNNTQKHKKPYTWNTCANEFITSKHGCRKCSGSAKYSTEEWIIKAKQVHGDKYDYSKVDYVDNKTKVLIICNDCKHEFQQNPKNHLRGHGCPKCAGKYQYSSEEFIEKAKQVHGNKYDYSKAIYVDARTKVIIICNDCKNEFQQIPDNHLRGSGCAKCAGKYQYSTEEFIEKAKQVHGNKYDYSKVNYIGANTKVIIICNDCKNEFWQTPDSHLSGSGCSKCAGKYQYSTEEFIEKAKQIHGDKYDYSKAIYVNNKTKVSIICNDCKNEFQQTPNHHLKGSGCSKCAGSAKYSTEEWIIKAKQVHDNKYDYSKVNYVNSMTKVPIICNDCKHEFWQIPNYHLQGYGCPECAKAKRSKTRQLNKVKNEQSQ